MSETSVPDQVRVEARLAEVARTWGGGWRRYFFPAFWLVSLGQTVDSVAKHSTGTGAVIGYVVVVAFAACYRVALPMGWERNGQLFWPLYGVCFALTAAELPFGGVEALVFCVYLAVLAVASHSRWTPGIVAALILAAGAAPM